MMTPAGIQLLGRLRGIIGLYPGVKSLHIDEARSWSAVTVGAVADDFVHQLAEQFGLGQVMERRAERDDKSVRWYFVAVAEQREYRNGPLVSITVVGPHHIEPPEAS
jgi:hypothetical protein